MASLYDQGSPPFFSMGDYGTTPNTPMFSQPAPISSWQPASSMNSLGVTPPNPFDPSNAGPSLWDGIKSLGSSALGTTENPGWGGLAVSGAGALMNGWMGMKQYGLAKQALAENKRQFQMNYDAAKSTTNTQLEDRQRARVAANPGAYQSVGPYMGQNGIK